MFSSAVVIFLLVLQVEYVGYVKDAEKILQQGINEHRSDFSFKFYISCLEKDSLNYANSLDKNFMTLKILLDE